MNSLNIKHYVPDTTEKTEWSVTQGKLQITQRKKAQTAMSMIHESLKNNSHAFILVKNKTDMFSTNYFI